MSNLDSTGAVQNSLAKQREEQQKAIKRKSIQSDITSLNTDLTKVKRQISKLSAIQLKLKTYLEDWNSQKKIYNGNEILSEVVIINVFEGVCADKIKEDMGKCISKMGNLHTKVSRLNGNINMQISRLKQYETSINAKLAALKRELSML